MGEVLEAIKRTSNFICYRSCRSLGVFRVSLSGGGGR